MSRRSDREGIDPCALSLPITKRSAHAQALRIAAVERRNGLKRQALKWLNIAKWDERYCPYHKAFDAFPPLPA